jgi:hypothetical protein
MSRIVQTFSLYDLPADILSTIYKFDGTFHKVFASEIFLKNLILMRRKIKPRIEQENTMTFQSEKTFDSQLHWDKVRKYDYINARKLCDLMGMKKLPFPDVTDTMIDNYLDSKSCIHREYSYYDTWEMHAQKVAYFIDLIQKNALIRPFIIFYDTITKEIVIEDGWHRIRAAYYLNENVSILFEAE